LRNTAFRESEVTIDGNPAGVAPVYPWIFTGGIDPELWIPIPGVQTLNFKPYRVNLTPSPRCWMTVNPYHSSERIQRRQLFLRDRHAPALSR